MAVHQHRADHAVPTRASPLSPQDLNNNRHPSFGIIKFIINAYIICFILLPRALRKRVFSAHHVPRFVKLVLVIRQTNPPASLLHSLHRIYC